MERSLNPDGSYVGPHDDPNRYELEVSVGSGGEGQVFRATLEVHHQAVPVAVKLFRDDHQGLVDFNAVARDWQQQVALVQTIDHPSIVRMREAFVGPPPHAPSNPTKAGRVLGLVMNWVDGVPLTSWVTDHPRRTFDDVARLVHAIASGVSHLHSGVDTSGVAILHRDLKPSNILVSDNGRVSIIDFGLARASTRSLHLGLTPAYCAPEAWAGEFSERSDLYSLAATAYFLIVGENPSEKATLEEFRHGLEGSPIAAAQPALVNPILSALAVCPDDRPQTIEEWSSRFHKTTVGQPVSTLPTPPPEPPQPVVQAMPRSGAKRRGILLVAAALILALVAAGVAVAGNQGGSEEPVTAAGTSEIDGTPSTDSSSTTSASSTTSTTTAKTAPRPSSTTMPPSTAPLTTVSTPHYLYDDDAVEESGCCWSTGALNIGGEAYPRSLLYSTGFYDSVLGYDLGRKYSRLDTVVGASDSSGVTKSINWQIVGDGRELASGTARLGELQSVSVPVTGILRLQFGVTNWSGEGEGDMGFGDARLIP